MTNFEQIDISGVGFSQVNPPSDGPSQSLRYTQPPVRWDGGPNEGNPWSVLAAQEAAQEVAQEAARSSSSGGSQVGIAITRAAAEKLEVKMRRKRLVSILNTFLTTVENFCPVCYFLNSIPDGPVIDHVPLVDCVRRTYRGETMYEINFRAWKGEVVNLPGGYKYCFPCGSPQERKHDGVEPAAHLLWSKTTRRRDRCPFVGLVFKALYALWFDRELLDKLRRSGFPFPVNIETMSLLQYGRWLVMEDGGDERYWNGLELLVFRLELEGWKAEPVTGGA